MLCSPSTIIINSKSTQVFIYSNMASNQFVSILVLVVTLLLQRDNNNVVKAQLTTNFYSTSCPNLLSTVKSGVKSAVSSQPRMGASILRLFFHDCFVNVSCFVDLFLASQESSIMVSF